MALRPCSCAETLCLESPTPAAPSDVLLNVKSQIQRLNIGPVEPPRHQNVQHTTSITNMHIVKVWGRAKRAESQEVGLRCARDTKRALWYLSPTKLERHIQRPHSLGMHDTYSGSVRRTARCPAAAPAPVRCPTSSLPSPPLRARHACASRHIGAAAARGCAVGCHCPGSLHCRAACAWPWAASQHPTPRQSRLRTRRFACTPARTWRWGALGARCRLHGA